MPKGAMTRPITTICGMSPMASGGLRRCRNLRLRGPLHETGDRVGQFGAPFLPESDTVMHKSQAFLALGCHRVEKTDSLDKTPVAPVARISDDYVEKRALFGAAARKANDDHDCFRFRKE